MSAKLTVKGSVATPPAIQVGGTVTVNSLGVNVRSTPAGTQVGTQPAGATGTVVAGPTNKPLTTGGVNVVWWQIDFATGVDGWAGADNLIASAPPPPVTYSYHNWNALLNTEEGTNPNPTQLMAWINTNPPKAD